MTEHDNDIDALLDLLAAQSRFGFHSALTALLAERNKLVEDNASQTYKGNSVCYWHDKANAYKATIGSLWEILESAAVRPDGERTITAALTALVAERDALREQLRLANIDEFNAEFEEDERDLRESNDAIIKWIELITAMVCDSKSHTQDEKLELASRALTVIKEIRKGEADGK